MSRDLTPEYVRLIRSTLSLGLRQCDTLLAAMGEADTEEMDPLVSPERVTCPKCKSFEHQAPAGDGEYVCGVRGCGANYKHGEEVVR